MTCPHKNILTELTLKEKNPRAIFLSTQLPDRSLIQTTARNFHYLINTDGISCYTSWWNHLQIYHK